MIEVIEARVEDRAIIADICRDCNSQYEELFPGFLLEQANFLEKYTPKDYYFKVIKVNEKIIGFLALKVLNKDSYYLAMLYFYKSEQKKGYGKQTLKVLENLLTGKNLYLLAHKDAYWALNFYKRNGFEVIATKEKDIVNYNNELMKNYYYKDTYLFKNKY